MMDSFFKIKDLTVSGIVKAWYGVYGTIKGKVLGDVSGPDLGFSSDEKQLLEMMNRCLSPAGGEITARYNTVTLGKVYQMLSDAGKLVFFRCLVRNFDVDHSAIADSMKNYSIAMGSSDVVDVSRIHKVLAELTKACAASRAKILRQFISLPNGLKFLVDMREDLIRYKETDPMVAPLENELYSLLASWFEVELLDLVEITWNSPASLLEKLVFYEAVHKISSWDDLKSRLSSGRLCFTFFHHKMQLEPIIFVEVALMQKIPESIDEVLDKSDQSSTAEEPEIAVFYSISNAQAGLKGINLGNFLIKRVVERIDSVLHGIKTYVTISPVPLLVRWIKDNEAIVGEIAESSSFKCREFYSALRDKDAISEFVRDNSELSFVLLRVCAYYLIFVKKQDGKVYDPVANFHLGNGALIKRINCMADQSSRGISQSLGVMVNYQYDLENIDRNHENYVNREVPAMSREVSNLIRSFPSSLVLAY